MSPRIQDMFSALAAPWYPGSRIGIYLGARGSLDRRDQEVRRLEVRNALALIDRRPASGLPDPKKSRCSSNCACWRPVSLI